MSDNPEVRLSIANNIADVCFGYPEKRNALGKNFWSEIIDIFEEINQSPDVRVVILRSEGKHFAAGIDLELLDEIFPAADLNHARTLEKLRRKILNLQRTMNVIEACRVPVLAVVQGACIGAGMDLVSVCDIIYATEGAFFCIEETNIGLPADLGSLQRLPQRLPFGLLRELAFTGRKLRAEEAHSCDFVTSVHADYDTTLAHARRNAAEVASKSPLAILGTKQAFAFGQGDLIGKGLDYIATWNAGLTSPVDIQAGIEAAMHRKKAPYRELLD